MRLKFGTHLSAQIKAEQEAAKEAEAAALQERISLQKAHAVELSERLEALNAVKQQHAALQVGC